MAGIAAVESGDAGGAAAMGGDGIAAVENGPATEGVDSGGYEQASERAGETGRGGPLAEFRSEHSDEFLEPMARSYPIDSFSEPEGLVERINPDYGDPSGAYDQNSADCSRSFERSWRGDFEEAAGRAVEVEAGHGFVVQGEPSSETEEWAGGRFTDVYDSDGLRSSLRDGGHGSSAIVHTDFIGPDGAPGGHAYNVVNDHGTIRVCDAQVHAVTPWTEGSIHPELGASTWHRAMAWGPDGTRIW